MIAQSGIPTTAYKSARDGIISFTYDGFEQLTEENLKIGDFDKSNYEPVHMENQMSIQAGEPAYKLITDETWCVYVCLDKATADK